METDDSKQLVLCTSRKRMWLKNQRKKQNSANEIFSARFERLVLSFGGFPQNF